MASLAIYIIVLLVVAAVVIVAGVFAYNKRLDRVTRGEARDTHSAIPEPSTTVGAVYKIVLMVLAVITLLTLSTANGMLFSMQNTVNDLNTKLNRLSGDIFELQQQLEASGRRVSLFEWDIRDPDYTNRTATVCFSAVLREYAEDTEVSLKLGAQTAALSPTENPGEYSGRLTVHFFEQYGQSSVCIREGGKTYVEPCDFIDDIFWQFLPMPSLECRFDSDVKHGKLVCDGSYTIVTEHPEDIASVTVTYLTNGREIRTFDATAQTLAREEIALEQGMELEKDLCLRIEIVTKSGYRIVDQNVVVFEARPDYEDEDELKILDLTGTVLWEDREKG